MARPPQAPPQSPQELLVQSLQTSIHAFSIQPKLAKTVATLKSLVVLINVEPSGSSSPSSSAHDASAFNERLPLLLPLLPQHAFNLIPLLSRVLLYSQHSITHLLRDETSSSTSAKWKKGEKETGEGWEDSVEMVLVALKEWVGEEDITSDQKEQLGEHTYPILCTLLTEPKLRPMLHRRVLDVFEYSTSGCDANKKRLVKDDSLGPLHFGTTERALELAFRLARYFGVKHGKERKAKFEGHLFSSKYYTDHEERKKILEMWRGIKADEYDEDSAPLLDYISKRSPDNFKCIATHSLRANDLLLLNFDHETNRSIKDTTPVSFNLQSFTAIYVAPAGPVNATGSEEEGSEDDEEGGVQTILEVMWNEVRYVHVIEVPDERAFSITLALTSSPRLDRDFIPPCASPAGANEIVFHVHPRELGRLKGVCEDRGLAIPEGEDPSPKSKPKSSPSTTDKQKQAQSSLPTPSSPLQYTSQAVPGVLSQNPMGRASEATVASSGPSSPLERSKVETVREEKEGKEVGMVDVGESDRKGVGEEVVVAAMTELVAITKSGKKTKEAKVVAEKITAKEVVVEVNRSGGKNQDDVSQAKSGSKDQDVGAKPRGGGGRTTRASAAYDLEPLGETRVDRFTAKPDSSSSLSSIEDSHQVSGAEKAAAAQTQARARTQEEQQEAPATSVAVQDRREEAMDSLPSTLPPKPKDKKSPKTTYGKKRGAGGRKSPGDDGEEISEAEEAISTTITVKSRKVPTKVKAIGKKKIVDDVKGDKAGGPSSAKTVNAREERNTKPNVVVEKKGRAVNSVAVTTAAKHPPPVSTGTKHVSPKGPEEKASATGRPRRSAAAAAAAKLAESDEEDEAAMEVDRDSPASTSKKPVGIKQQISKGITTAKKPPPKKSAAIVIASKYNVPAKEPSRPSSKSPKKDERNNDKASKSPAALQLAASTVVNSQKKGNQAKEPTPRERRQETEEQPEDAQVAEDVVDVDTAKAVGKEPRHEGDDRGLRASGAPPSKNRKRRATESEDFLSVGPGKPCKLPKTVAFEVGGSQAIEVGFNSPLRRGSTPPRIIVPDSEGVELDLDADDVCGGADDSGIGLLDDDGVMGSDGNSDEAEEEALIAALASRSKNISKAQLKAILAKVQGEDNVEEGGSEEEPVAVRSTNPPPGAVAAVVTISNAPLAVENALTAAQSPRFRLPSPAQVAPIPAAVQDERPTSTQRQAAVKYRDEEVDEDKEQLAKVLHELSAVVLHNYQERKDTTTRLFEGSKVALTHLARKFTAQLAQESADIVSQAKAKIETQGVEEYGRLHETLRMAAVAGDAVVEAAKKALKVKRL